MKQKKYYVSLLSFFLAITILLTSCSSPSIPTNANTAFQNFTRNLFEQDVVSTTIGLHYTLQNPESYGIKEIPITYGSFDVDETASYAALENCSAVLDKFSYDTLSKENQITYDVLSSYLDTAKKGFRTASTKNHSVRSPAFRHNFRFCSLSINFFCKRYRNLFSPP